MNAEELKRLEEIKSDYGFLNEEGVSEYPNEEVGWLISRLEAEAQENERLQQRERDLIGRNDIDVHEGMAWCDRAKAAEARLVESEGVSLLREKGGKVWERQAHEAEATCQSLRDQSSLWEAQALEAAMCIAELKVQLKESERFGMSIARAYGEGSISNTSKPQAGGKEER